MGAGKLQFHTVEDYLVAELASPIRHEYLGGTIHAMGGSSIRHNEIALEIYSVLKSQMRGGPCRVVVEAVKLHIRTSLSEFFYYPDVMVGCDLSDRHDYYPSSLRRTSGASSGCVARRIPGR